MNITKHRKWLNFSPYLHPSWKRSEHLRSHIGKDNPLWLYDWEENEKFDRWSWLWNLSLYNLTQQERLQAPLLFNQQDSTFVKLVVYHLLQCANPSWSMTALKSNRANLPWKIFCSKALCRGDESNDFWRKRPPEPAIANLIWKLVQINICKMNVHLAS